MTTASGAKPPAADPAGTERIRDVAMLTAERFMQRLAAMAARAPLSAVDVREAYAAFRAEDDQALARLFADCAQGKGKAAAPAGDKRTHALERAMIARFESRFDHVTADGQKLSRRAVIGFSYALTKALTPEGFREFDMQARRIADGARDAANVHDQPQLRRIVDSALVALARSFDDEFLVALKTFTDLINSRLSAPKPKAWDAQWELSRPLAVTMLDDLYADLRGQLEAGTLHPAYGRDAEALLTRFFAGLDRARKLADRPWLRKALGQMD